MNRSVKVEIQLIQTPTAEDEQHILDTVQSLTSIPSGILMTHSLQNSAIVVEFILEKATQAVLVESIYSAFKSIPNYQNLTITFPKPLAQQQSAHQKTPLYTQKQGQYLAFIYYYTKIHRVAPAETDIKNYFRVTSPSVHRMLVQLEACGFISQVAGQARRIQILLPREQLPDLA